MTNYARTAPVAALSLFVFGLTGCGAPEPAPDIAEQGGEAVECALDGAEEFSQDCRLIEPADGTDGKWRVVHPDGGFRLFEETSGDFATADGADQAETAHESGKVTLTVENDRYRWME